VDLHLFDLNLLVALDALLRERNVTQAGVHLNLSQSAMSGVLARLRSYFQDELLIPVGRRMVLTPLAETLVEPLRDVLTQIRGTLGTKPRFDLATTTRHMSIAASDYMIEVLLADVLRRARALAPFITFQFLPVGARASEALELGELDFLIAPMHLSSAHPTEVLFEDTWTCIAWTENKSIGESLPLDHYLALGHVVVQIGDKIMYDEDTLRRFKYRRRVEVSVPSFSLASHLVVGTDRIATVKTRLALQYQRVLPIRLLPLPVDIPPTVETLQWHWVHEHHPSHRWFRCLLKEAIAALPPAGAPETTIPRRRAAQRVYAAKERSPEVRSQRAREVNTKSSHR
jgi:LysR family transcriptional regulator, nod-box dependent transcriptional activator